jgi:hypothetical protein
MIVRKGEVELRLTTARARPRRRAHWYTGRLVRLVVFWIAPVLLVLCVAYVMAGRG